MPHEVFLSFGEKSFLPEAPGGNSGIALTLREMKNIPRTRQKFAARRVSYTRVRHSLTAMQKQRNVWIGPHAESAASRPPALAFVPGTPGALVSSNVAKAKGTKGGNEAR